MGYIRTANNIYELHHDNENENTLVKEVVVIKDGELTCLNKSKIIKKPADTIPELCDAFVVMTDDGRKITCYSYEAYVLLMMDCKEEGIGVEAYGAIWTTGEKGEPILKSIAKRCTEEGKEDLKLL